MELIQQQFLPGRIHSCQRIFRLFEHGHAAPHFGLTQCQLRPAVPLLDGRLRGEHAAVRGEIQFPDIGMPGAALCLHILKELNRSLDFDAGHALQVMLTHEVFYMIAGRTAAAVPIAKGQQKRLKAPLFNALFPRLTDFLRVRAIGIAGGQERINFGSIRTLPGEIVVRELISLIV